MPRANILIVDDEKLIRWSMKQKLESWNYDVSEAEDLRQGRLLLQQENPDLVTLDIKLPDGNGIELLKEIRELHPGTPVIMITAFGVVDVAVQALRLGAYDFIEKPINFEKLDNVLRNALETHRLKTQVTQTSKNNKSRFSLESIVGKSKAIHEVLELIKRLAQSGASTLLVQGESGTGKDLVSRALHYESTRRDNPFFALNCAAIPETLIETELFGYEKGAFTDAKTMKKGVFEMADRGTVFLDEISEMHINMQSKFLRVLEDQTFRRVGGVRDISVDVQVVASTNRDLEQAVREGKFREDLFYRLNVFPVEVPALRARREDIPALVDHFIERYARKFGRRVSGCAPGVRDTLAGYDWPGNVRELQNVIERAMISSPGDQLVIDWELRGHARAGAAVAVRGAAPAASPAAFEGPPPASAVNGDTLVEVERQHIIAVLKRTAGTIEGPKGAAKLLDMKPSTARYRMKKLGIRKSDYVD